MTPDDLYNAARALYGARWMTPLEKALGVSHRTLRQWCRGERPIPIWAVREVERLGALQQERD